MVAHLSLYLFFVAHYNTKMNHLMLKLNTRMVIGDKPMVLLPLDIYEKITKSLCKPNFKTLWKNNTKKAGATFLAVASESSLSKDWFKPEEEKAWKNL